MNRYVFPLIALLAACHAATWPAALPAGELELLVTDQATGKPIPVRVHLRDQRGRVITPRGQTAWSDHFAIGGKTVLNVGTGSYLFEMERGPEYRTRYGNFEIERGAADNKSVDMQRFVDMKSLGWYAGDLLVKRPPRDMELLMLAEDLYMAAVLEGAHSKGAEGRHRFDGLRYYDLRCLRDRRAGGTLLLFGLGEPLAFEAASPEYPSPLQLARLARGHNAEVHIAAGNPVAWDLPIWASQGLLDSVMLLNEHQQREGVIAHEGGGRPRDRTFYPGAIGNGRWGQDVYYHLLNCGFRIPPSAGSGSGEVGNPVGYNRVYVHCGEEEEFSDQRWWDSLLLGRVMITNGPLLIPRANGHVPGHVFKLNQGSELQIEVDLKLFLKDEVDYLEFVKDGKVVHEVRLDDWAKNRGRLPPVIFTESGWFLIRAVTNHSDSYRMATTGPYYVEMDSVRRISKQSAQFFLDWVYQRARQLDLANPEQQAEVLAEHRAARDFFQAMVENANAE